MSLHAKLFVQTALVLCIVFVLGGYAYVNTIDSIFAKNTSQNINLDLKRIQSEFETIERILFETAQNIQNYEEVIASVNLISNYEDRQNYKALVFDAEKQKLIKHLQNRHNLEYIAVSIYDDKKNLIAQNGFIEGSFESGYVTYDNAKARYVWLHGDKSFATAAEFETRVLRTSMQKSIKS
jgi:hypothetical protein